MTWKWDFLRRVIRDCPASVLALEASALVQTDRGKQLPKHSFQRRFPRRLIALNTRSQSSGNSPYWLVLCVGSVTCLIQVEFGGSIFSDLSFTKVLRYVCNIFDCICKNPYPPRFQQTFPKSIYLGEDHDCFCQIHAQNTKKISNTKYLTRITANCVIYCSGTIALL